MHRFAFVIALLAGTLSARAEVAVDVEIVLAVDISMSMDVEEQRVQRDGYVSAITSREVLNAIGDGMLGRIAVTYVEWAGIAEQRVIVPWQIVDGEAAARNFAAALSAAPLRRVRRTSISGALDFGASLFADNDFAGARRVIDVSGDGPNNQGPMITDARDRVLAQGIVINGLPLMFRGGGMLDIDSLDGYYRQCVVGGDGSFVLPVAKLNDFAEAIRRKLVLEIADAQPFAKIQRASGEPQISCTIGEYLWEQRMRN